MGRFAVAALATLLFVLALLASASGSDACERGPPGTKQTGEGFRVGNTVVNGMTTPLVRTIATPEGTYVVIDLLDQRIERWTESNTWPGLQRSGDCLVTSNFVWADTLDLHASL